jgi:density-regulated protein DRP1
MKKVAKKFATKFACGASVVKNAAGLDEIVIQGDVLGDIFDALVAECPDIPEDSIDLKD